MLLLSPLLLLLGLYLPGFFLAKHLRHSLPLASAFVISLVILFHCVFWPGVFRVPLTLWTVLPGLLAVSAAAAWLARNAVTASAPKPGPQLDKPERILIVSSALVGAVLLARSAVSPLIGPDAPFRWDFLAQRMLALRSFSFYPPLTPADFRSYFYVDGIPPLVSFAHWWLYVSAGRYLPALIAIFVAAQFVCTLAFTYGAASALYSRRAGVLAAAMLAASPLFFRSSVLGQETGLTALSIAATLYFVVTAREPDDWRPMLSAGLAAALGALSREYGWIALIVGIVALVWRRQPRRQILVFAAVATAVAAPWYLRNWILAGNPFYSLRFAGFAVNPIHDGIMQYYNSLLGPQKWTDDAWTAVLWFLLPVAAFQILAGIPGAFMRLRPHGYLAVSALLLSAVWLQSAGYTSGGIEISTRVLSAAMVVLSITAAGCLDPLARRPRWHTAMAAIVVLLQVWTAAHGVFYPSDPLALKISDWPQAAFRRVPPQLEFQIADQLAKAFPAGVRVLSENAYLHAALLDKGIEVVPVWSPEVRFLFSAPPEESDRRLRALGIGSVVYYSQSLNTAYLASASPFYASLPRRWRVQAQVPGLLHILVPATP